MRDKKHISQRQIDRRVREAREHYLRVYMRHPRAL